MCVVEKSETKKKKDRDTKIWAFCVIIYTAQIKLSLYCHLNMRNEIESFSLPLNLDYRIYCPTDVSEAQSELLQ